MLTYLFGMNEEGIEIRESSFPKGYERLRKIGKGASGTAFLYRKISNKALVVIKEIPMSEMRAGERQLALNEVQVLKILDHPNIISYYKNFEKDGTLFIEMEYADGGTLAQYLRQQLEPLKELQILFMFKQIVSAIKYVHSFNILHRDLKTANIFLTKERVIKVGDFGISKIMTTASQANSVLGTPYYISPEMCEGKDYNDKSDIWALGCILYEMTCLRKAFEGTNLPSLVNKIMKGKFQPVPVEYSAGLRQLIGDLLQKNPNFRPSAAVLLDEKLPQLLDNLSRPECGNPSARQVSMSVRNQSSLQRSTKTKRSVLYELASSEQSTLIPIPLPPQIVVQEIAVSNTHFIALTAELEVYTWGEGKKGQLGQGIIPWSENPKLVEMLQDKNIRMVSAGDGFSVFASESGMILTCGDGEFGCLGHGDWSDVSRPKVVEKLLTLDITAISCGDQHVLALSAEGELYSWGRGLGGRLGVDHEKDSCSPNTVLVPDQMVITRLRCGRDATMVITSDGNLLACGKNTFNKLGLSKQNTWLKTQSTEKSLTLKRVISITEKVTDVSLGRNHTAVLTARGQVITMGSNAEGQKGIKNTNPSPLPTHVSFPSDSIVTIVKCGHAFSIMATVENEIYLWGNRHKSFDIPEIPCASVTTTNEYGSSPVLSRGLQPFHVKLKEPEPVLEPKGILALYASAQQIEKGETVNVKDIFVSQNRIFVLVDTTVPLVRKNAMSNGERRNIS